ncbi:MAG: RICIN domain-containing protein [Acidiferrobacterales bacterium]|nr:RICIN domain-containing protein [Acidiferrobacterales bacterium]
MKNLFLLIIFALTPISVSAQENQGGLIRLVDGLDEPEEFYCIDLLGWGESLAIEDPLQAHTCKTRNAADQMFSIEDDHIRVTEFDRCLQVAGSSNSTLPGSAVLARDCDDDQPMQKISLNEDGQLVVNNSDYCIAAGAESAATSGPSHMWRPMSVVKCDTADKALATWQIGLD